MHRKFFILAAFIMLSILGTSFYYVGRKIYRWLRLIVPGSHIQIFTGICVFFTLSIVLGFLPFNIGVKKIVVWFAFFLIGLFVYFLLFFILSDIVLLAGKILRLIPSPTPQNFIVIAGWIALAGVAGMASYGVYHASRINQASYTVQIEKESSIKNLNIVLIADLHLGYLNDDKWLAKIVDKVNALEPDIVCIAGDVFNDNFNALSNPTEAARSLQKIKSVYGVYACMGNHDGGKTFDEMLRFLEQGNVKALLDEYAVVEDKFIIIGRKDSSPIGKQGEARKAINYVTEGMNKNMPVIVLDHNPANIKEYGNGIDLILAGHTHKGQLFPANFITRLLFDVDYGYYRKDKDSPHVVVTSGAGVWGPPLRTATDNELARIFVDFKIVKDEALKK